MLSDQNKHALRPEAKVFNIDDLSKSQREACIFMLDKLDRAKEELHHTSSNTETNKQNSMYSIRLMDQNPNRTILLSGGRGSGKTSVLFTLISILQKSKITSQKLLDILNKKKEKDRKIRAKEKVTDEDKLTEKEKLLEKDHNELNELLTKLHENIIWLDLIEMETVPATTNLLAAILTRFDKAVERVRGHHPSRNQQNNKYPFGFHPDDQDILLEFSKLQHDVALSCDGNLTQRAASIDPDVFAVEVLRSERIRLNLDERLNKCINDLHENFFKPQSQNDTDAFFVLPVDDFDINPFRCLELVRLIRMLNIPRLFTIILGDDRIISHVLNLKFIESSFPSGFSYPEKKGLLPNIHHDTWRLSHELSANAMRKLFAPSHQFRLKPMPPDEVFSFKPDNYKYEKNSNIKSIKDYLNNIKDFVLNTAFYKNDHYYIAGREIENLFELFNITVEDLIEKHNQPIKPDRKNNHWVYIGRVLFKLYPRHVQDLWRYFHEKDSTDSLKCFDFVEHFFKQKRREGRNLTLPTSELLSGIVDGDFVNMPQMDTSALHLIYTYGQPIILSRYSDNDHPTSIGVHHPKNWMIKYKPHPSKGMTHSDPNEIMLHDSTAAAVVLLHDLLAFSNPKQITGKKLIYQDQPPPWAYTLWPFGSGQQDIKVSWYYPPWLTMFECDLLRRCWVEVWTWMGEIKEKQLYKPGSKLNINKKILSVFIPITWITIITGIMGQKTKPSKLICLSMPDEKSFFDKLNSSKFKNNIIKSLSKLSQPEDGQCERRRRLIDGWFAAIACLLAPESNLPDEFTNIFLNNSKADQIKDKFIEDQVAKYVREMRAKSAVKFFDHGALTLLNALYQPIEKINYYPLNVYRSGTNWINNQTSLRPFFEDIIQLSTLDKHTKNKYRRELSAML